MPVKQSAAFCDHRSEDDGIRENELRRISLKYEGRCVKCGRTIPAGETAYWDKDKGVWHLECAGVSRGREPSTSKTFWGIMTGIVIVAFILGGFVLGPAFTKPMIAPPVTVTDTVTEIITETITATPPSSPFTTETAKPKWLNPSDPNVVNWAEAGKYVGKTKTVEGTIVRTYRSPSNTVFLNFHDPYQGYFYGVIFASDLKNFPFEPEDFYRGKDVRITGLIKLYQGSPEIIVEDLSQIEVAYMGYNYP